jgi:hypothetical protein
MKTHGFVKLILCAAVALVAVACSKKDGGGGASSAESDALYKQADTSDNLKGLLETIVKSGESGDTKKAGALTGNLIADEAALKKAFKDDAGDALKKVAEANKKFLSEPEKLGGLLKRGAADRTEVQVHGATTEEIASGAASAKEFPGGAVDAAKAVLRPAMKFYEVEFVKPGEDTGMKYHMFFWDGAHWKMLGPVWRALK